MNKDENGNLYEDFANIRITYKKQSNWGTGNNVLSFRAYKNLMESNALHIGAEIELESRETILELIESLRELYNAESGSNAI